MIDFANVKEITLGSSSVKKIMRGSDVLWEEQQPQPVGPDYLCFTAAEANSTVAMTAEGSAPEVSLEWSTDKQNWSPFVVGSTTVTLTNVGEKMYLRGDNLWISSYSTAYNKFVMTGKIAASGNVMSLLDKTVESTRIKKDYTFYSLFRECTSLMTAPRLPATTLLVSCYDSMFRECTSLITAPELPATTLNGNCYYRMFYGCESLVEAPELPATTLGGYCYYEMFYGCESLVEAPELPATMLKTSCYGNMFKGCTRLESVKVAFTAFGSNTIDWLDSVKASGTFYCPSTLDTSVRDGSHVPAGWTVVNV